MMFLWRASISARSSSSMWSNPRRCRRLWAMRNANSRLWLCPYSRAWEMTRSAFMTISPSMSSPVSGSNTLQSVFRKAEKSAGESYSCIGKERTSVGRSICLNSRFIFRMFSLSVTRRFTCASYGHLVSSRPARMTFPASSSAFSSRSRVISVSFS